MVARPVEGKALKLNGDASKEVLESGLLSAPFFRLLWSSPFAHAKGGPKDGSDKQGQCK